MNPNASAKGPGRVKYRLQRFLLARSLAVRSLRFLLPVGAVAAAGIGAIAWSGYGERATDIVPAIMKKVKYNPEFMISGASIQGASPHTEREIRALLPIRFPASPFDIDARELKRKIESLPAAESARVSMNPSGYVEIAIVERTAAIIWRNEFDLLLLDSEGRIVGSAWRRLEHPELPLVAGAGADAAIPEALQIIAAAKPIAEMIRGLVRVGERRWDIVLDQSRRVMLPEEKPVAALAKLIRLNDSQGILSKAISIVDLRDGARMTVRLDESEIGRVSVSGI